MLEMKQKRTKHIKSRIREQGIEDTHSQFSHMIVSKQKILDNFTEQYLEDLLV
jgi:hypothetical protein